MSDDVVVLVISAVNARGLLVRDHSMAVYPQWCLDDAAGLLPLLGPGARLSLYVGGILWRYEAPRRRRKWKVAA